MAGIFVRKDLPYFLFIMKNKKKNVCIIFARFYLEDNSQGRYTERKDVHK